MMLTAQLLREILHYDPETGVFIWKVRLSPRVSIGDAAGTFVNGYRKIKIDSKPYFAHRLAWLYMTGAWPSHDLDHANCDPNDNRFINLREATPSQNQGNRRTVRPQGKGSYQETRRNYLWYSMIRKNGKTTYLGTFRTEEEAHNRYLAEAKMVFGEFARAG